MAEYNTLAENGNLRLYRAATVGDIDLNQLVAEILNSGLTPTVINGGWNSYRTSDGFAPILPLRVVRGDGVNTRYADSGLLATTENILGVTVLTDGAAELRVATAGSIIDGFVGLTKHAIYYLGAAGAISLVAGVVPVVIGVALSATKLLFAPASCACYSELELLPQASSSLFLCPPDGARYELWNGGVGENIPVVAFDPAIDRFWYSGFYTPSAMDTGQSATLRLRFAGDASPSVAVQWLANIRSVPPGSSIFAGGVVTPVVPPATPPAGNGVVVDQSIILPIGAFVAGNQNRLRIGRQGSVDTYLGTARLIGVTLLYPNI